MNKRIQCVDLVLLCLGILTFANIFFLIFRIMRGECAFGDFHARWQESAYVFRGVNPYDVLSGEVVIDKIGAIDPDMITVPWAWLWGSIINPGFLKYEYAQVWGGFFFLVLVTITSCVCYQYIEKTFNWTVLDQKRKWCMAAFFIVFSQYCWVWAFMCGNQGALACCFIVIAVCIYIEHPYLAGILMTFAMIKPQVAALFFITFFILKQYRLIITTVVAEILTMLVLWMVTGANLFQLLGKTADVGVNLNGVFFGLFNMLKYLGISTSLILFLDIVLGVVYLLVHTLLTQKYVGGTDISIFMGATIASTFWFYKQSHDYVILIIPCLILLKEIFDLRKGNYIFSLSVMVIFIAIFYVQSATRKVVCKIVPSITEFFGKELFMTFTCFAFIILGIVWLIKLKKRVCN